MTADGASRSTKRQLDRRSGRGDPAPTLAPRGLSAPRAPAPASRRSRSTGAVARRPPPVAPGYGHRSDARRLLCLHDRDRIGALDDPLDVHDLRHAHDLDRRDGLASALAGACSWRPVTSSATGTASATVATALSRPIRLRGRAGVESRAGGADPARERSPRVVSQSARSNGSERDEEQLEADRPGDAADEPRRDRVDLLEQRRATRAARRRPRGRLRLTWRGIRASSASTDEP